MFKERHDEKIKKKRKKEKLTQQINKVNGPSEPGLKRRAGNK